MGPQFNSWMGICLGVASYSSLYINCRGGYFMTTEQLEALREWVRSEIIYTISGECEPRYEFDKLKDSFKPDYTKLSRQVCDDHS